MSLRRHHVNLQTVCAIFKTDTHGRSTRALAYTWHGRFSDGSTDNTSRGRPKYKNCRIVKSAPDDIDCDLRRAVREVAEI